MEVLGLAEFFGNGSVGAPRSKRRSNGNNANDIARSASWSDRALDRGCLPESTLNLVSQNRYSAALDPFQEFAVRLSVYGKVCFGPPFLE